MVAPLSWILPFFQLALLQRFFWSGQFLTSLVDQRGAPFFHAGPLRDVFRE